MNAATAYEFDLSRFDFDAVHIWLASAYWSPGISRERVERGFRASTLCIGAFLNGKQIGVARVVSDTVRFAYIADVFVDEAFRRRGIAREMVRRLMANTALSDVEAWHLVTRDAHAVYAGLGFGSVPHPERFMIYRKNKNV